MKPAQRHASSNAVMERKLI